MRVESIKFRGHRCFSSNFAGFETVKPVNVLIGRNNSGKSHMIDFAEALCGPLQRTGWEMEFDAVLGEEDLKPLFPVNTEHGDLEGNHWHHHGRFFIGAHFRFTVDPKGALTELAIVKGVPPTQLTAPREKRIQRLATSASHALTGRTFRRLNAERNILPEGQTNTAELRPDGVGASNLIRRILLSSSLDRDWVEVDLLNALTEIFGTDGAFMEITVKHHDDNGMWEVYLLEKAKGLVQLSRSGSGLKTVILVLLNLLVIPKLEKKDPQGFVFGFEELENNLHPALLRRLFRYLERFAVEKGATMFLTTHSSVALDAFASSTDAQIIRVTNDGACSSAATVSAHLDHIDLVSELGAKPSDLLQANGVIWVEGPSDRVYVNHWIALFSDGRFREGRDYQCAFYGGSLLAQIQFTADDDSVDELVNLFRLNHNIAVVCDSDKPDAAAELKGRVKRVAEEVAKLPSAHLWITGGKEMENYLPGASLQAALDLEKVPDPGQFARFFPSEAKGERPDSFVEKRLERRSIDKVELASKVVAHMTNRELLAARFDLADQMGALLAAIERWNR